MNLLVMCDFFFFFMMKRMDWNTIDRSEHLCQGIAAQVHGGDAGHRCGGRFSGGPLPRLRPGLLLRSQVPQERRGQPTLPRHRIRILRTEAKLPHAPVIFYLHFPLLAHHFISISNSNSIFFFFFFYSLFFSCFCFSNDFNSC